MEEITLFLEVFVQKFDELTDNITLVSILFMIAALDETSADQHNCLSQTSWQYRPLTDSRAGGPQADKD